jgi:hypothetical protein
MSKEKRPSEEGCDKDSKGYIEIDISGFKDKLDDGCERLFFGSKSRKFDGSSQRNKGEGRLGVDPIYGKVGMIGYACTAVAFMLCLFFRAYIGLTLLMAFMLLLCMILTVIGLYEIRFDKDGFSIRFGKKVIRAYKWSDVTDAQDGRKVWVKGKRLLTDHSFDEFPEFYKMARAACKGTSKPTTPSAKKRKSRQKPPTKPQ